MLLCVNTRFASFWPIVHMDPVNALFWNVISGWKNLKTLPLCSRLDSKYAYLAYRWHHRATPQPLALDLLTLEHLITTTTMVDYTLVFVPQKILSLLGLLGQNIMLLYHYTEQKMNMDNRLAIFIFFVSCSVSPSTVCLYTVCKLYAQSLLLCFWWISRATYRPGIWTTACWVISNGSIWKQIFLKRCQERRGKKIIFVRVDMA